MPRAAALVRAVRTGLRVLARPHYQRLGWCNVCRRYRPFLCARPVDRWIRACLGCRSSPKYRAIVAAAEAQVGMPLGQFLADPAHALYELTTTSSVSRVHGRRPNYVCSGYFSDRPFGVELRPRVWNADAQNLPFPDAAFDLVISSETFEHVRDPWAGFREVRRVLKPGGSHVFTVPFYAGRPTVARVDVSGPEDRYVLPKVYHEDPYNRVDSLVYTDFGDDLPARLEALGYAVEVRMIRDPASDIQDDLRPVRVFVATRTGSPA